MTGTFLLKRIYCSVLLGGRILIPPVNREILGYKASLNVSAALAVMIEGGIKIRLGGMIPELKY